MTTIGGVQFDANGNMIRQTSTTQPCIMCHGMTAGGQTGAVTQFYGLSAIPGSGPNAQQGYSTLVNLSVTAVATFGPGIAGGIANYGLVTVTHFTSAGGAAAIGDGGTLYAGSFVTTADLSGLTATEVESTLEIGAGKGAFSTTFQTTRANLGPAFNGPLTSGGAPQFQLVNPTPVTTFVPTP